MEENRSRSEAPSEMESEDQDNQPKEDADMTENPKPFKKPALISVTAVSLKKVKSLVPDSSSSSVLIKPRSQQEEPENPDSTQEHDLKQSSEIQSDQPTGTKKVPSTEKPNHNRTKSKVQGKVPPSGKFPPLPYTEPPWAGVVGISYAFELLKNGSILETVPLSQQSYFVVGRLPVCDISLEHPSISRYHAVVQYRAEGGEDGAVGEEPGFYVYDLGSTHGTVVNKNKIPPKTYIRLRVGHVVKFGGSTRLFILQGPESDEEAESELSVTELREKAKKQREELEKRMMGDGSDDDDDDDDDEVDDKEKPSESVTPGKKASEDAGCSWGMDEDVAAEEDENEENPFATEFQEDQEAAYLKDPKKALQGFYDREGEELEFEYDDKGHGTWLCRIRLPVDDAMGRQLVAEVTHPGKKKEAAVQCCLEACRMLEARGLLRQEAVSRKRKKKNWEDEDFYDSDDDAYLDRTGTVEKKRNERMKKAGKIQERPETYDSLVNKLAEVQKELSGTEQVLRSSERGGSSSSADDPLDAFMSSVRSQASLDGVQRKKLHLHVAELKREAQRLNKLIELTRPTALPSLQSRSESLSSDPEKPKKLTLPLFGAMKGGSKFRLKTGAIGKLPLKRPNLPPELFNMKELPPGGEQEEEEEQESADEKQVEPMTEEEKIQNAACSEDQSVESQETRSSEPSSPPAGKKKSARQSAKCLSDEKSKEAQLKASADAPPAKKPGRKMLGPSRPPHPVMEQYPEDDPDYCVWVPPAGQSGDGRTHLNEKYGY